MKMIHRFMLVVLFSMPVALGGESVQHHVAKVEKLGEVTFPTSCSLSVQKDFRRGVALLHSFAYEDATEKSGVTLRVIKPARELLGEMLLELEQPAQALVEFETALRAAPNRFNGLYGAARAAEHAGNLAKAKTYYAKLADNCKESDSDRPELVAAKHFLQMQDVNAIR